MVLFACCASCVCVFICPPTQNVLNSCKMTIPCYHQKQIYQVWLNVKSHTIVSWARIYNVCNHRSKYNMCLVFFYYFTTMIRLKCVCVRLSRQYQVEINKMYSIDFNGFFLVAALFQPRFHIYQFKGWREDEKKKWTIDDVDGANVTNEAFCRSCSLATTDLMIHCWAIIHLWILCSYSDHFCCQVHA